MIIILRKIYLVVSPLLVTISRVNPTMTRNILESVCNHVHAPNPRYRSSSATAAKVYTEEFPTISQALKSIDRSQSLKSMGAELTALDT